MPKTESKTAKLKRLKARRDALTGKNTEQMRASLQDQIDALEGKGKDKGSE